MRGKLLEVCLLDVDKFFVVWNLFAGVSATWLEIFCGCTVAANGGSYGTTKWMLYGTMIDVQTQIGSSYKTVFGRVISPCLRVTRGDHVSWPTMKTMIPTMMMINMSTDSSPIAPLRLPLLLQINQAHHIRSTQCMGDGKPTSP
jgi:hypothetical protein